MDERGRNKGALNERGMGKKKRPGFLRAVIGALMIAGALLVALPTAYRERRYLIDASGCELQTTVIEPRETRPAGTVILLHGLAANREIMTYVARGFAAENLRVFVPDLPGHGRTRGPFSPGRAGECAEALAGEIFARGLATPQSTVLAGHSMGGAIALQVAAKVPVAGVIAISPAPMNGAQGVLPEALIFGSKPATVRNALVVSGGAEPRVLRANAQSLAGAQAVDSKYEVIPWASHVSLIFDPRTVRAAQEWATRCLHLPMNWRMPSQRETWAFLAGFAGILLLAGPFLREAVGPRTGGGSAERKLARHFEGSNGPAPAPEPAGSPQGLSAGLVRGVAEVTVAAVTAAVILRWWNPLREIRLFQGDYLAGFFFLSGLVLLALRYKERKAALAEGATRPSRQRLRNSKVQIAAIWGAALAGLALFLLASGWTELTCSEAWLTGARWWRFPVFFLAALPYHMGEELLLGPTEGRSGWRRWGNGMLLRAILWIVLAGGIYILHSGEILLGLIALYFALLFALQRRGMDVVRKSTGSAGAAAVFGAILLAGFCLVIFPIT
jgi:pimeloyl-ACP methyl ester carboxylesterase